MSKVKKTKKVAISELAAPQEPKKKVTRIKKQPPTKEESLQMLKAAGDEIKQIIQELKGEETRFMPQSAGLPKIAALVQEALTNLAEDLQEIEDEYNNLSAPEVE